MKISHIGYGFLPLLFITSLFFFQEPTYAGNADNFIFTGAATSMGRIVRNTNSGLPHHNNFGNLNVQENKSDDESIASTSGNKGLTKGIPVYPSIQDQRTPQTPDIRGKIILYETSDLMEKVAKFYQENLGIDYQMVTFGLVEFILEKGELDYASESPSYGKAQPEALTSEEHVQVPLRGVVVRYNPGKDITEIITYDLDREDAINRWRQAVQHRAEMMMQGPQLYIPREK